MKITYPCVFSDGPTTCVAVNRTATTVTFIPMSSLSVTELPAAEFDKQWVHNPLYPVKRAAERYMLSATYRTVPAKSYELLEKIAAQAAEYPKFDVNQPLGKLKMATKKTATAPAKAKPVSKALPKSDKPAAPAKVVAAVKAADKAATVAKVKTAKAATEVAKPAKAADTTKYKVGDVSSVKRGFLADYVEAAHSLKTFTRDALEATFNEVAGTPGHAKMRTYFPYCVGKGILAAV